MFPQACVILSTEGWVYLWCYVLSRSWVSRGWVGIWVWVSGRGGCVQGGVYPSPDIWDLGYYGIESTSRQYAFYWNAFLFGLFFVKNSMKMKKIGLRGPRPLRSPRSATESTGNLKNNIRLY